MSYNSLLPIKSVPSANVYSLSNKLSVRNNTRYFYPGWDQVDYLRVIGILQGFLIDNTLNRDLNDKDTIYFSKTSTFPRSKFRETGKGSIVRNPEKATIIVIPDSIHKNLKQYAEKYISTLNIHRYKDDVDYFINIDRKKDEIIKIETTVVIGSLYRDPTKVPSLINLITALDYLRSYNPKVLFVTDSSLNYLTGISTDLTAEHFLNIYNLLNSDDSIENRKLGMTLLSSISFEGNLLSIITISYNVLIYLNNSKYSSRDFYFNSQCSNYQKSLQQVINKKLIGSYVTTSNNITGKKIIIQRFIKDSLSTEEDIKRACLLFREITVQTAGIYIDIEKTFNISLT